ncbi:MAG: hypothetical protein JXL97_06295 [Bacteroidales bacterium]|nr:hypothetical protein [Bacteroidales bacterium]
MKIFAIILILFLVSCSSNKTVNQAKTTNKEGNKISVTGVANYNSTYCGGARPTEEVLEKYNRLRPMKNTTIKFVNTDNSKKEKTKTDENGNFSVNLSAGNWEYYLSEDFYDSNNEDVLLEIQKKCDELYNVPYGTIEIFSDTTVNLIYHLPCNPCDPNINMRP